MIYTKEEVEQANSLPLALVSDWLELRAEVERLKQENATLRDRLRDEKDMNAAEHIVQDRLQAEVERLKGGDDA